MPTYNVSTGFTGVDRVSPAFTRMGASASKFENRTKGVFGRIGKAGGRLGDFVKGNLIAGGIQKGAALLAQGIGAVATEFINFDDAIVSASAKFGDLDAITLDKLKMSAREVGATTKFSATEAAQGLDFLAMAGFNATQSMALLAPNAKLATVAGVDLARSTDIASDSIGAFGLMTDDTTQLQANFIRMNDSMAATITKSNTNIETLFESIKKGAPAFTAAGQSMNTFNTLAGVMANSGVKGAESGTVLRNVMLRLAEPTAEAEKVLNKLNIRTQDSQGNFRDVVDILSDFETGLKGMGTAQKTAALSTVFGARAVTGINILLSEGTEKIRSFRGELDASSGAADRMAGVMESSLGNKIKALQSAAIELGFKFFDAFGSKGKNGIDIVTNAIRNLNVAPIIDILKQVFDIFSVFEPVAKLLMEVFVPALQSALNIVKILIPLIRILFMAISILLTPAMKVFEFIFKKISDLVLFISSKISPLVNILSGFMNRINSKVLDFFIGEKESENRKNTATAPNAVQEEKNRVISGEGTITVKAEQGTSISNMNNGISGVNLAMAGVN